MNLHEKTYLGADHLPEMRRRGLRFLPRARADSYFAEKPEKNTPTHP